MTYTKPKDVTYTEMAIWIDENAYKDDCDDEQVYRYIYLLIEMLARKANYFDSAAIYDEFAIHSANRIFLRLKNPRQFGECPTLPKIKSILNYIKKLMRPMRVTYQQQFYSQTLSPDSQDVDFPTTFASHLSETLDGIRLVEFNAYMHDIPKTVKNFVSTIPKKKDSAEWINTYFSILFTLLRSVTFSSENNRADQQLERHLARQRTKPAGVFHLPESSRQYVQVLVNEIRHIMKVDMSGMVHTNISTPIFLDNLVWGDKGEDNET